MKEESKGGRLCNGPEKGVCCTHIRTERGPESGVPKVGGTWAQHDVRCKKKTESQNLIETTQMDLDLGPQMLQ